METNEDHKPHISEKRKASIKAAQARHNASPQRKAYDKSDPRKDSEALRKRLAYHGVSDPQDLPEKSTRGRKAKRVSKTDEEA